MARGGRRNEPVVVDGYGVMYDRILASLKPDREITAGEFLKRAFTFPQIERVKIQKFSGGTWNFAEDLDNLGPGFNPEAIEQVLREKYGAWRFRLLVIAHGEVVTQHIVNLDGWQENEAKSVAQLPRGPSLTPNSRPAGPGASSELLSLARERIEVENTTKLLQGLATDRQESHVAADLSPVKMMAEMMTVMMTMMKDAMAMSRGGHPPSEEDRFTAYLRDEIRFMRDQMNKPAQARDTDALVKTVEAVDGLLNRVLNTSLAEIATGTTKTEATGWAATIQGVIEGIKPYLPDMLMAIKAAVPSAAAPRPPARVIPLPVPGAPPSPGPPPPSAPDSEGDMPARVDPAMVEIVNMLIDALRSKNFKTIDAILMNPPLQGRVVIDPEVPAATYALLFRTMDPRFGTLHTEIAAYQEYVLNAQADDGKGD